MITRAEETVSKKLMLALAATAHNLCYLWVREGEKERGRGIEGQLNSFKF